MKKIFLKLFILLFISASFSCNNTAAFNLLDLNTNRTENNKVDVSFSAELENENSVQSKTLLPTAIDYSKFTKFTLSGTLTTESENDYDVIPDSERTFSASYSSLDEMKSSVLKLTPGNWSVQFKSYMDFDGTETLVSDTSTSFWIYKGSSSNKVTLKISFNGIDKACMDITVNFPYAAADSVEASLNYFNSSSMVLRPSFSIPVTIQNEGTSKSFIKLQKDDLSANSYYLVLKFYKNDAAGTPQLICTKMQLIVLLAYHTTTAELTYNELNTPYTITYKCADEKTTPITWNNAGNSASPDGFNTSQDIVLQPINAATASRSGYELAAETWYEDYACTKPITGWKAGEKTGDVIVYSKWTKLPGVPLYVSASGNDSNDGLTMATALATFDAAWTKCSTTGGDDYSAIYMVDDASWTISANQNEYDGQYESREQLLIKRVCSSGVTSSSSSLLNVTGTTTVLRLSNIIFDGGAEWGRQGAIGYGLGLAGAVNSGIKCSKSLITFSSTSGTLTLGTGCEVRNNHCTSSDLAGGVHSTTTSGYITVKGAKIYNNYGDKGGGIYNGDLLLRSGTIGGTKIFAGENHDECDGNFSSAGGGVYGKSNIITIETSSTGEICYNASCSVGAGVYFEGDVLNGKFYGGKIHHNYAINAAMEGLDGAALYILDSSVTNAAFNIKDCEITDNFGRSIVDIEHYMSNYIANTSITGNYIYEKSPVLGHGAIYQNSKSLLYIKDGAVVNNNYLTQDPVTLVKTGDAFSYYGDTSNIHAVTFDGNGYLGGYVPKNTNTFKVTTSATLPAGVSYLAVISEDANGSYSIGETVIAKGLLTAAQLAEKSQLFALKDANYRIDSEGKKAYKDAVAGAVICDVGFGNTATFSLNKNSISRATGDTINIGASISDGVTSTTVADLGTTFANFSWVVKNYGVNTSVEGTSASIELNSSTVSNWPAGNYEVYITGKYQGIEFSTTLNFTLTL